MDDIGRYFQVMRCSLTLFLFVAFASLGVSIARSSDVDAALRERFLSGTAEAEQAIKDMPLQAKYTIIDEHPTHGNRKRRPTVVETFRCAFRGGQYVKETEEEDGNEIVTARNPKYAFKLSRSLERGSCSLTGITEIGSDREESELVDESVVGVHAIALGTFHLYGKFLWEWVRDPDFVMKMISSHVTGKGERIRIEFEYNPADSNEVKIERAFLICDPSNKWALTEYGKIRTDGSVWNHTTVEFTPRDDGPPTPDKMTTTFIEAKTSKIVFRRTVSLKEMSRGESLPTSEFYLSNYGLPEPNFRRAWLDAWPYYLIIGIVCLALSWLIVKRRKARG